ncbi:MAG: ABC transporter substrate-binding protein [Dehalococcoidia bacterium]
MTGSDSNVWLSRRTARMGRRGLIRGGLLTGAGLAGTALVGCGSTPRPAAGTPQASPAAGGTGPAAAPGRPGVPVVKGTIKDGGTWTEPITATSSTQDMHTTNTSFWQTISEGPLIADPYTGEPQANLIEKWEVPDSTHIVFHVAKGTKLHNVAPWNGREFDAEDLAFNMNRTVGSTAAAEGIPKGAFLHADWFTAMDKIEVVDKYTARVTLKAPSSAFLINMVDHRNMMMPKGVVEVGFKDPMKLAGLSAFQLTEFVPGVREVYTRFQGYRRPGQPHIDKIINTVTADRGAQIAGFISKQFSILTAASQQDIKTVQTARPDVLLYKGIGISWHHFRPNFKYGAFGDFRVRKAMQLAANYQEIGDGYYGSGWGYLMGLHSYFPESWNEEKVKTLPGYNPATKAKDREDAVKMMSAAGHDKGDGITFEMLTSPGWSFSDATKENALRFQSQMQQLWPNVKITIKTSPDVASFAKAQADKSIQAVSYAIGAQRDIGSEAYSNFHSKGVRNYGSFENKEADAMIEKALVTLDAKERAAIFQGPGGFMEKFFNEWMPMITFNLFPSTTLIQPNVQGYDQFVGPWASGRSSALRGSLGFVS